MRLPRGDTWLDAIMYVGVAMVVVVAAVVSYRHMHVYALANGEDELNARILPLSVDGLMGVSAMVLVCHIRRGRRGWALALPWAALLLGVAASVAANVAAIGVNVAAGGVTERGGVSFAARLIAGWAPVALALALELILRRLRPAHGVSSATPSSMAPDVSGEGDSVDGGDHALAPPARVNGHGPTLTPMSPAAPTAVQANGTPRARKVPPRAAPVTPADGTIEDDLRAGVRHDTIATRHGVSRRTVSRRADALRRVGA